MWRSLTESSSLGDERSSAAAPVGAWVAGGSPWVPFSRQTVSFGKMYYSLGGDLLDLEDLPVLRAGSGDGVIGLLCCLSLECSPCRKTPVVVIFDVKQRCINPYPWSRSVLAV